jgi:Zn-dependent peptidase ImmA (M78 family)
MLKDGKQRHGGICFKEILIIGAWSLWNHRNRIIFDNEDRSKQPCFVMFKEYFALVMHRAKPSLKEGMQQWIDSL